MAATIGPIPPDSPFSGLELTLRRGTFGGYAGDLRFQDPQSAAERRRPVTLPPIDLRELALIFDPVEYGVYVGEWLLGVATVQEELNFAAASAAAGGTLHVTLSIGDDASELHRVRWEMMRDPETKRLLFVGESIVFSRYVSSTDFRRVQRRARSELRALVVISDPTDIKDYPGPAGHPLSRVRVEDEERRIRTALGTIPVTVIPSGDRRATLDNITAALRGPGYDIFYLVCHGAIIDREPQLWLQAPDGKAHVVGGKEFADRITELRQRPSLVVLASCQSGGAGEQPAEKEEIETDGAHAALGPYLGEQGIPAVLAMQGNVTVKTIEQFMPIFFTELSKDGQLDRAASVARGQVRDRPDAGVPVLSTRLKGGGIWYRVGWDTAEGFQAWEALRTAIVDGSCTPILGPGMLEGIHGNRRDLARELAEKFHFPLAPQDRDELPQVAQYRLVAQDRKTIVREYLLALCERIQGRYPDVLDKRLLTPLGQNAKTEAIVQRCTELQVAAWEYRQKVDPNEPHRLLVNLPFDRFITTNADPILGRAVRAAVTRSDPARPNVPVQPKVPVEEYFRWSRTLTLQEPQPVAVYGSDSEPPSEASPLVYQLFGRLATPDSLVLTQDDYFDALIAASLQTALPKDVRSAFTARTLLFLGFNIDDWNFRVLFRFIVSLQGAALLQNHPHVAVQIDPDEQRFNDPRAARRYLARYFGIQHIEIFWGSVEDFIVELERHYEGVGVEPLPVEGGGV